MKHVIFVYTFHKCGLTWNKMLWKEYSVLSGTPYYLDLKYNELTSIEEKNYLADIMESKKPEHIILCQGIITPYFFFNFSHIKVSILYTIRDLRDMLISAYFYHLWSHEKWLKEEPRCIQQRLKKLNKEDGLLYEISVLKPIIRLMRKVLDIEYYPKHPIRYEDAISKPVSTFFKIAKTLGLPREKQELLAQSAKKYHFNQVTRRKLGQVEENQHTRSGKPGQWREHFTDKVRIKFKKVLGKYLIDFGYEEDYNW